MRKGSNKKIPIRAFSGLFAGALMACLLFMSQASGGQSYVNSFGMEFVKVPAGSFMMGSPAVEKGRDSDEKLHKVTIKSPFFIQTTEVTVDQWRAVMGKRPLGANHGGNLPVVKLSWNDSSRFIARLNARGQGSYRLPTEAEWEYACRAGSQTAFWWGDDIDCTHALYANNSQGVNECGPYASNLGIPAGSPAPVKTFPPNPWGIFDMHGNTWEWCSDWYGAYSGEDSVDPQGPAEGSRRVRRGGSWFKYGNLCRSANRNFAHPASRYSTVGFRLIKVTD